MDEIDVGYVLNGRFVVTIGLRKGSLQHRSNAVNEADQAAAEVIGDAACGGRDCIFCSAEQKVDAGH